MKLYLMRHGEAEAAIGKNDHDRELTPKGIQTIETAAGVISNLFKPSVIYSSPRIRAFHTAEIVAKALDMQVEVSDGVNFGFGLNTIQQLISPYSAKDGVMFVGHEPTMSAVIEQITGARVHMKKGMLARIDLFHPDRLQGLLVWLIAPKVFNALG